MDESTSTPLVYAGGALIVPEEDALRRGPGGIIGIIIALIVIFIALRLIGLMTLCHEPH